MYGQQIANCRRAVLAGVVLASLVSGCGNCGPAVEFEDASLLDPDTGRSVRDSVPGDGGGSDAEAGWEIEPEDMFEAGEGCQYPTCDETVEPPVSPAGEWTRTLQTTATNCSDFIQESDERAKVGARNSSSVTIPELEGACLSDGSGDRVGAVRGRVMARCLRRERRQGVVSYTVEVVSFDDGEWTGRLRTYIRGLPEALGGDCHIDRQVRFAR